MFGKSWEMIKRGMAVALSVSLLAGAMSVSSSLPTAAASTKRVEVGTKGNVTINLDGREVWQAAADAMQKAQPVTGDIADRIMAQTGSNGNPVVLEDDIYKMELPAKALKGLPTGLGMEMYISAGAEDVAEDYTAAEEGEAAAVVAEVASASDLEATGVAEKPVRDFFASSMFSLIKENDEAAPAGGAAAAGGEGYELNGSEHIYFVLSNATDQDVNYTVKLGDLEILKTKVLKSHGDTTGVIGASVSDLIGVPASTSNMVRATESDMATASNLMEEAELTDDVVAKVVRTTLKNFFIIYRSEETALGTKAMVVTTADMKFKSKDGGVFTTRGDKMVLAVRDIDKNSEEYKQAAATLQNNNVDHADFAAVDISFRKGGADEDYEPCQGQIVNVRIETKAIENFDPESMSIQHHLDDGSLETVAGTTKKTVVEISDDAAEAVNNTVAVTEDQQTEITVEKKEDENVYTFDEEANKAAMEAQLSTAGKSEFKMEVGDGETALTNDVKESGAPKKASAAQTEVKKNSVTKTISSAVDANGVKTEVQEEQGNGDIKVEDGKVVADFVVDSFSIYTIVDSSATSDPDTYSIKYEFYYYSQEDSAETPFYFMNNQGEKTYFQYVGEGETLYNPGVPVEGEEGKQFLGWYEKDAEVDSPEISVDEDSVTITGITSNQTIKLYARFEPNFYIQYIDARDVIYKTESELNNDFVVTGKKASLKEDDSDDWRVPYQPDSANLAFLGWSTKQDATTEADVVTEVDFTNAEDNIVTLYPVVAPVFWINFDKNDWVYTPESDESKADYRQNESGEWEYVGVNNGGTHVRSGSGATYVAPLYVLKTDESVRARYETLPTTNRPGYKFNGWLDKHGEVFDLDTKLESDITLYADWEPESQTYSIVIWKLKATAGIKDESEYTAADYDVEVVVNAVGTTGETLTELPEEYKVYATQTNGSKLTVNGREYDFTGYHHNTAGKDTSSMTVESDGSSVWNIYYNRNVITIRFNGGNNGYVEVNTKESDSGNTVTYNGKTYASYVEYKGLYESELNFNWPTQYLYYRSSMWGTTEEIRNTGWYYGSTVLSFVGNFKLPNPTSSSITLARTDTGNVPITFIRQSVSGAESGNWDDAETLSINMGGGTFTITDKYTGFYAYEYKEGGSQGSYQYVEAENGDYYYWPGGTVTVTETESVWIPGHFENWRWIDGHYETREVERSYYEEPGYYEVGEYPDENAEGTHNYEWVSGSDAWVRLGQPDENGDYASVSQGYTSLDIRFARKTYVINFIDSFDSKVLGADTKVYEAPLADVDNWAEVSEDKQTITYTDIQGNEKTVSHEGYTFDGWYTDSSCKTRVFFHEPTEAEIAECNKDEDGNPLYSLSTEMPANNISVYANWKPLRFRIWIQPNGGELSPTESTFFRADWSELVQEYADVEHTGRNYYESNDGDYYYINIADPVNYDGARVAYYVKVSEAVTDKKFYDKDGKVIATVDETDPEINGGKKYKYQKGIYEFVGWYKVEGKTIEDDVAPAIDVKDKLSAWNFNTPIKENTAIRAMWKRLGRFAVSYDGNMYDNDGITVIVEKAEDAEVPATSEYSFGDLADAISGQAPTTTPKGWNFVGWKTPTGDIVQPDEVFTVYANYATQADASTEEDPLFIYKLTAVYSQIGTTSITYDPNGGEGTLTDLDGTQSLTDSNLVIDGNTVSNVKVNSEVTLSSGTGFTRIGYVLVGWNDKEADADAGKVKFDLGKNYGVGEATTLYAVWQKFVLDIEFTKVDKDTRDAISGVEFELKATSDGDVEATKTSDRDGIVSFTNLIPQTSQYLINEKAAPSGYKKLDGIITANNFTAQKDKDGKFITRRVGEETYIVATAELSGNLVTVDNNKYVVENQAIRNLTIIKDWSQSPYGTTDKVEVKVTLTKGTAAPVVQTVVLNGDNSWTAVLNDIEYGTTVNVEEVELSGYETSYKWKPDGETETTLSTWTDQTLIKNSTVTIVNKTKVDETGIDLDSSAARAILLSLFAFAMMCALGFSLKRRYISRR